MVHNPSFIVHRIIVMDLINQYLMEWNGYEGHQTPLLCVSVDLKVHNV